MTMYTHTHTHTHAVNVIFNVYIVYLNDDLTLLTKLPYLTLR